MPRRREPDVEDAMRRCPQCGGVGELPTPDPANGKNPECPLCLGDGRVGQAEFNRHMAASLTLRTVQ